MGINNCGQIIARGGFKGQLVGLLLTPIKVPGDFGGSWRLDAGDLDLQANAIQNNSPLSFDLTGDESSASFVSVWPLAVMADRNGSSMLWLSSEP